MKNLQHISNISLMSTHEQIFVIKPYIQNGGTKTWFNDNIEIHRENGPAQITPDGDCIWMINDEWHRTDGPAIIWANGLQSWYVNGKHCKTAEAFLKAANLTYDEVTDLMDIYGDIY